MDIIYKSCPFYLYEMALIESYLSDMSKEGLHIQALNGYFEFEKGEPKDLIYKMAVFKNEPTKEQLDFYEQSGANFLFNHYDYYFFCLDASSACSVELQPKSERLNEIYRKIKTSYILFAMVLISYVILLISFGLVNKNFLTVYKSMALFSGAVTSPVIPRFLKNLFGYYNQNRKEIQLEGDNPSISWRKWKNIYRMVDYITYVVILVLYIAICFT